MSVKLLTENHLEFLSLKGDSTVSSESTLVKTPNFGNHVSRLNIMLISNISTLSVNHLQLLLSFGKLLTELHILMSRDM